MRLFQQNCVRTNRSLDGVWDFRMEGFEKAYRLPVPGAFEQHPDFMTYRGVGTYTKQLFLSEDTHVKLFFEGVSHTCDVFWDDRKVGHHYNAFTGFELIIPNQVAGNHKLEVVVDNRFSEASSLHVPNDYYSYGGITRSVQMETLSDLYVKQVHVTPLCENSLWQAEIKVLVENLASEPRACSLQASLNEDKDYDFRAKVFHQEDILLDSGESVEIRWKQDFPDVKAWSDKTPNLYLLQVALAKDEVLFDDRVERIGFRTIRQDGKRILLNGQPVFIRGFNRHEDYAVVGCAVPLQLMMKDMDILEDLGANSVRCSHYPNDSMFLDLCDERGVLVWEESHARGFELDRMLNPNFDRQSEDCIREMVAQHYNHPSIYIWGVMNECASQTPEGRVKYEAQLGLLKELDQSRLTTFATFQYYTDICLDIPDVVSYNMYAGWYVEEPSKVTNKKILDWIKSSGGDGKPVIVSEFGAGAVYGYRDRTHAKWSEERQCDIIKENLEEYLNHPDIAGVYLWQFADVRVTEEEWFQKRPRTYNNKGIVDEFRRPKLAYDVVKQMYEADAAKRDKQ